MPEMPDGVAAAKWIVMGFSVAVASDIYKNVKTRILDCAAADFCAEKDYFLHFRIRRERYGVLFFRRNRHSAFA
jgi:hypothetical protein